MLKYNNWFVDQNISEDVIALMEDLSIGKKAMDIQDTTIQAMCIAWNKIIEQPNWNATISSTH